jgi:ribose 5-phosphate isomerase B
VGSSVRIGIAADHAGQRLKSELSRYLRERGHDLVDYGANGTDPVDYPEYAVKLARAIVGRDVERGIFACGSGIGPSIAANKVPGIRAAVVTDEWSARDAVEHVDVNFLTLGERVIGVELAKSIVDAYLGAKVQGGRHERRREQIAELERGSGSAGPSESASDRAERVAGPKGRDMEKV